jgi:hypothetical protein
MKDARYALFGEAFVSSMYASTEYFHVGRLRRDFPSCQNACLMSTV